MRLSLQIDFISSSENTVDQIQCIKCIICIICHSVPLNSFRWSLVGWPGRNIWLCLHRCRQSKLWQLLRKVSAVVEERGNHRCRQCKGHPTIHIQVSVLAWGYLNKLIIPNDLFSRPPGAVGRKGVESNPRWWRHCGHRQAEQEVAPWCSNQPQHAHSGGWAHTRFQIIEQIGVEDSYALG